MRKILIVDDEVPVRKWFIASLEKYRDRYHVIEATNGEDALELSLKEQPDLVFTDIAMPVMNGLEYLKELRKHNLDIEVVILTCYEQFEYARQALEHDAYAYLLKAELKQDDLFDFLQQFEVNIAQKNYQKNAVQSFNIHEIRSFLHEVYELEIMDPKQLESVFRRFGLSLGKRQLFCIVVKVPVEQPRKLALTTFFDLALVENLEVLSFEPDCFIIIGNFKNTPSRLIQHNYLLQVVQSIHLDTGYSIGVSGIYLETKNFPTILREAIVNLKQEFYEGKPGVYMEAPHPRDGDYRLEAKRLYQFIIKRINENKFIEAEEYINKLLGLFERERIVDKDLLVDVCQKVMQAFQNKIYCLNEIEAPVTTDFVSKMEEFQYFEQLKDFITARTKVLVDQLTQNTRYSPAIRYTLDYIATHYAEPISQTQIAEQVHLNPEYFCRLFKEETGENFSVYLMMYRLKIADELLKTKDYKIYEVAEKVGYPNASYFSRIYRRYK